MHTVLVNTTFFVHDSLQSRFLKWLRERYMLSMSASESFADLLLTEILVKSEPDVTGYALQAKCENQQIAASWIDGDGCALRDAFSTVAGDKFLHFTTYMKILQ